MSDQLLVRFTCEACGWQTYDADAIAAHMEDVVTVRVHVLHRESA